MPNSTIQDSRNRIRPLLNLIVQHVNGAIPEDDSRALMMERRGLRLVAMAARQIRDIAYDTDPLLKAEQADRAEEQGGVQPTQLKPETDEKPKRTRQRRAA